MRYITTTKNLLIEITSFINTVVENGIVKQRIADTVKYNKVKLQLWNGATYANKTWDGGVLVLGKNTLTFTTDTLPTHTKICFGLNGRTDDATVQSPITLKSNQTYTLSFDCINVTQGQIAWTNSMLEEGSTATPYVPYGYLPMYKGRYKVSNVCQLLDKSRLPDTQTINGVTFTNNGDGTITVNGTANADARLDLVAGNDAVLDVYSKLLYLGCPAGGSNSTYGIQNSWITSGFTDVGNGGISSTTEIKYDGYYRFGYVIGIKQGYTANNLVFKPQLFDLTEMYGAGNEPTTVAEFREKFPDDLYPYSPYCWAKIKSLIYKDNIDYIKMK